MDLVTRAQVFAHEAHDSIGQVRKYSGLPYWSHTDEVASIVASVGGTPEMIAAAHLHDVLEDVFPKNPSEYDDKRIINDFGVDVYDLVFHLTDEYTKENYPTLNRRVRKAKEADRLGAAPAEAQTIKLADLIANSPDILAQDEGFARTYIQEKRALLCKLTKGKHTLWRRAADQCAEAYKKLGLQW